MGTQKEIREASRTAKIAADALLASADIERMAAETAAQELAARIALSNAPASKSDAGESVVKTELEASLGKLGIKTATQVIGQPDQVMVKPDKVELLVKLSVMSVGDIVGFDPAGGRMIVRVNLVKIAELVAAHTKAPRVAGQGNGWVNRQVYTADNTNSQAGKINGVISADVLDLLGTIALASGVTITTQAGDQLALTGKAPVNGKPRTIPFVRVTYADGTDEKIVSYWLPGLLNAINARKVAITGDYVAPANSLNA